jgi:hypothetical protein
VPTLKTTEKRKIQSFIMAQAFCAISMNPARGRCVLKWYNLAELGNPAIGQAAPFAAFKAWELVPSEANEKSTALWQEL